MTPPFGINWLMYHKERRDFDHIEAMGYRSFTLYQWMWSNRDFVNELLSVARSDAIFLARDHPLSEQKDQRFINDPAGKGRAHADEWAAKVQDGRVHTPLDRTFFLGLNEPDSHHYPRQIDAYNEAYCRRLAEHGFRGAAYSFGVGQPATVDLKPDTLPDWTPYAPSALAVREGSHIVAVHEYGEPNGYGWGYWCNRIQHCPYEFDVIFDECGIDYGVVDSGELYGWAKFMQPDEYLRWLDGFQRGMAERVDTRKVNILAYNIFSFDHGSGENKDWHSFSIKPLIGKIEHFDWSEPSDPNVQPAATDQHTTHLPNVHGGGDTPPTAVDPAPQPQAAGILDPLVMEAFLQVESGGRAFAPDGRLLIRFEAHVFVDRAQGWQAGDTFTFDVDKPWTDQYMFVNGERRPIHTGDQATEWEAFELARKLDPPAAYESISMGAPQIMGFNAGRIGYDSAEQMFDAFRRSEHVQIVGLVNYVLTSPGLVSAVQQWDWHQMATLYNGSGAAEYYAGLIAAAYDKLAEAA